MPNFASVTPPATTSGVVYCSEKELPAVEGNLFNRTDSAPNPVGLPYGAAVAAAVRLRSAGQVTSNTCYVVLQTDLGTVDNAGNTVWYDVAWVVSTIIGSTTADFWLCGGVAGANAFQQVRAAGTAPSGHGSNQMCMGDRFRFVGKATLNSLGSSSSPSGSAPRILCTIRYKILGLR